jgi:putative heme-binding domain-containing protein
MNPFPLLVALTCLVLLPCLRAAEPLPRLAALLAESADPQLQLDVLRGMSAALRGRRAVPMPAGWETVETRLAASPDAAVRSLVQTLSLTFGSARARAGLRQTAADRTAPAEARRTALESLLAARDPELPPVLHGLLGDPAVRAPALRGLAGYDDAATPAAILKVYGQLGAEKRDALNTLASRLAYAQPLVAAVAAGAVPKADLTADLVRQLRNLKNAELERQLTALWGVMQDTSPDMAREVEQARKRYWAGGSQPGDAGRGRVVFNQVCAQCHRLFDAGGAVGPDITGANRGDLEYLLQNILYPNAVIPNEYRQALVETRDGRLLTGIVKSQDGAAVNVQTANELVTVPRAEVLKVEQFDSSMMPEGLVAQLDDRQFRDLLYYLTRPGQVPLPADAQ